MFEPVLQLQVVGDAAEQRHGGVRVGVDQAGREDGVGTVEALRGLEARVDFGLGADGHDAVAADGHGAVLDDAVLRVLGDDVAARSRSSRRVRAASVETKRKKLQIRSIEGLREKIFQSIGFGFAAQVDQHDFDVAAELPEDLAAGAAGRRESVGIGGHGHAAELADAFGDGFEDGHALGADGEAVSGVLDVAAGVDAAGGVFDGRADLEFGDTARRRFRGRPGRRR